MLTYARAPDRDWDRVALAVARKIGGLAHAPDVVNDRAVPAARKRPAPAGVDEPKRFEESPHSFRIQYAGSPASRGSSILKDVEIQVPNVSSAIVAAAKLKLPPGTIGLRILDREGREVFERHKGDGG